MTNESREGHDDAPRALGEVFAAQPESRSNVASWIDLMTAAAALGLPLSAREAAAFVRANSSSIPMPQQCELVGRFIAWRSRVDPERGLDTFDLAFGFLCGASLEDKAALAWCQLLVRLDVVPGDAPAVAEVSP